MDDVRHRLATHRTVRRMTKRTWFITGVGSGFGREMTEQLLARGVFASWSLEVPQGKDTPRALSSHPDGVRP
jgi:hypothetical protein